MLVFCRDRRNMRDEEKLSYVEKNACNVTEDNLAQKNKKKVMIVTKGKHRDKA